MSKELIQDESLSKVVGGLMVFDYPTKVLTFTDPDTKQVSTYQILNFEKAWELSNYLHAKRRRENKIVESLILNGYIQ